MKLNLACGNDKIEGWTNVDVGPECNPDVVADLLSPTGWAAFEGSCADEVQIRHFLEHIPHRLHWLHHRDALVWFMEEVYRVCADGATVKIAFPHHQSMVAYGDPTHARVLTDVTIQYFDALWRASNRFGQYSIATDFEIIGQGLGLYGETERADPNLMENLRSHWNVAWEVVLHLRAHKPMRKP